MAAALATIMDVGCELAIDLDRLDDHQCRSDQKACPNEKRCARLDDPLTGCADLDTCAPCVLSHASATCQAGVCAVASCLGDYKNCKGLGPGCETDLAHDPDNCGACNHKCSTTNGYPGCSMRVCAPGGCLDGYADCDGNPGNGCETHGTCPFTPDERG